jgi:hypothetical protein
VVPSITSIKSNTGVEEMRPSDLSITMCSTQITSFGRLPSTLDGVTQLPPIEVKLRTFRVRYTYVTRPLRVVTRALLMSQYISVNICNIYIHYVTAWLSLI